MKEIKIEDVTYKIPDYDVIMHEDKPHLRITEGKYEGVVFTYQDIKVNEQDESLIEYNLYTNQEFNESEMQDFQNVANDILLVVLQEAITNAEKTERTES